MIAVPNFALSGQTWDDQSPMTRTADEGESGPSNSQLMINDEIGTLGFHHFDLVLPWSVVIRHSSF
jgi:hypothetical protein